MSFLYHFTTIRGLAGIIMDGKINRGKTLDNHGGVISNGAVNLTDDPSPRGHGLPDGREISDQQAQALKYAIVVNGKKYCADHTAYRLQIMRDGLRLISVAEHYRKTPMLLKALALTAYYPLGDSNEPKNRLMVDSLMLNPNFLGKSKTWWYCMDEVPETNVVAVAARIPGTEDYKNLTKPEILAQLEASAQTSIVQY